MLNRLNALVADCSSSWWKFLVVVTVQIITLLGLQAISSRFPELAEGALPFDMQNSLQPEEIYPQLDGYSQAAFDLYLIFQAIDFIFPFVASLTVASVCAFLLRQISVVVFEKVSARKLLPLLLLPAVFDYMENICFLWIVGAYPERLPFIGTLAILAKQAKLAMIMTGGGLALILLVLLILILIGRRAGILSTTGTSDR